jgi:hypothetical protein
MMPDSLYLARFFDQAPPRESRGVPNYSDRGEYRVHRCNSDHHPRPGAGWPPEPLGHGARHRDRGRRLVILSPLSEDGSLPAAPAFVRAASVLFSWFATGLDNYVPGAAGPHTGRKVRPATGVLIGNPPRFDGVRGKPNWEQ